MDKFEKVSDGYKDNFGKLTILTNKFKKILNSQYPNRYQDMLPHCDPANSGPFGDNYFNVDLITLINDQQEVKDSIDKELKRAKEISKNLLQYKGNLLCDLVKNKNMTLERVNYYE